jgi:sugar lactone lactonase YvrE
MMIAQLRTTLAIAIVLSISAGVRHVQAGSQLLVAEFYSDSVNQIDASGGVTTFASGIINPIGLAVDQKGDVYVTSFTSFFGPTGTIEKFSPSGEFLGTFASGLSVPSDLAVDTLGNIYAMEYGTNTIEKFSSTGKDLGNFATLLNPPERMAFDSAGNLYVTNGQQIDIFSPTGAHLGWITTFGSPIGLAIKANTIYVAETADNVINEYSTSGAFLGRFASTGLDFTESMAFDAAGNLYASNNFSSSIEKFSPTGEDLGVFASGLNGPEAIAFAVSAVPEPTSLTLLVLGVAGLTITSLASNR